MSGVPHVLATFFLVLKKPWQKQFKEGRVYFGSQFEAAIYHGGQSLASHTACPVMKQREVKDAFWCSAPLLLFYSV